MIFGLDGLSGHPSIILLKYYLKEVNEMTNSIFKQWNKNSNANISNISNFVVASFSDIDTTASKQYDVEYEHDKGLIRNLLT
jgi:hypothetical protein